MTDLYWEQAGEGPPVVLVHEGIADSRMWEPQWRPYSEQFRVVRLDLRGFGQSPAAVGTFSWAGDVAQLLDELRLGPAALVGVSLGGSVAMEVAIARPELVSRLVLVAPGLRGFEMNEETKAGWEEEDAALERGDVDEAVEVNLRMWVDGPSRSPGEVDPEVRSKVGEMQRRAIEIYLEAGEDGEPQPLAEDWGDRLAEIAVPTLVIVGDLDRPEMLEIAGRLEAEIPNARRETMAGVAHVPSMERPDEFDRLVLDFLS
ncbi:MAG TPA: alpha/beta hydrolase [Gaiellaceae bacterium]|nr:alpha/beta hydrolase [Gaiellaceae bacterium]